MSEEHTEEQVSEKKNRENIRKPKRQMLSYKKKACRLCASDAQMPDYKNPESLKKYITERGRILPQRIMGTCAKHQRIIAREVKKARILAYIPFDRK